MIRDWSIAQKITLGLLLGPVALVAIVVIALVNSKVLLDTERSLVTSFQTRTAITSTMRALNGAESAQRGYVLTGELGYLAPYGADVDQTNAHLGELSRLMAGDPDQQRRLATAGPLVRDKLAELDQTIALRRTRGFAATLAVVRTNHGKELMDGINAAMAGALAAEDRRQEILIAADQSSADRTFTVVIVGTIATLGASVKSFYTGVATALK